MWQEKAIQSRLWQRTIPDTVDSLLLLSGASLAYILGFAPWHNDWLLVKLIAVLVYISLGFLAFREHERLWRKRACFILALCIASYVIGVAYSQLVLPWQML